MAQIVFMLRWKRKDILLKARIVVRTSNLKILRLADHVKGIYSNACCPKASISLLLLKLYWWTSKKKKQMAVTFEDLNPIFFQMLSLCFKRSTEIRILARLNDKWGCQQLSQIPVYTVITSRNIWTWHLHEQPISSERSPQSLSPSQCHDAGMQCPLLHLNCVDEQLLEATGQKKEISPLLSTD